MKPLKFFFFVALTLSACGLALCACALRNGGETPLATPSSSPPEPSPSPEPSPVPSEKPFDPERERRRVSVTDGMLAVDGGTKPIWINGVNTPWNKWNDFGGGYDDAWWDTHFAALHENGVNAVRVWVNCNNGQKAVIIDNDGMVSGVSNKHWADLDMFFDTAERHGIYIMATILSFDHFKGNSGEKWRAMVRSEAAIDSFIEHYTIPFVERYQDNPYLWSVDLMNEPDWVYENEECGKLPWEDISRLFEKNADAIHANSTVLVTVGLAMPKYSLPNVEQDFFSPHYYDWQAQWFGVPYTTAPSDYGLDGSKPAVLGECPANGSEGFTLLEDYQNAFANGWQGVMPWTSNGVDGNGGFDEVTPVTRVMAAEHRELVFPLD